MGEVKKILIVGLDQAGKTSILNILQEKYNKMDNIKPTVGIERDEITVFGFPIVTWDLGGQEKFRKDYLKNSKYFENTDSLFFVIDAVNSSRYDEALKYFEEILGIIDNLDGKPKLVLLIHKIDPNIRDDPKIQENIKEIKDAFLTVGYDLSIYITSIYDRKTIIEAFSKTFQELISQLKPLKQLLESIVLLLKLDAAILFDENLMILNEYYRNEEIEAICLNTVYNSIYYMTHTNPKLAENFLGNFELVLNIKHRTKKFHFMTVELKRWLMYLLTMGEEELDPDVVLSKFQSMAHIFEQKKW
ncbi:MAG: ADP-ribosylation factor-like protein [Candidatus Helarchaeota archaeon]